MVLRVSSVMHQLAEWSGIPRSHETQLVIFSKSLHIQLLCQHWAHDHFANCPENTVTRHRLPQSHRSLRAIHEKHHELCLTACHQKFLRPPCALHCYKRPLQLVGWDWPPRSQECPQLCSTSWQFGVLWCHNVCAVVFTVNADLALAPVLGL